MTSRTSKVAGGQFLPSKILVYIGKEAPGVEVVG